MRLGYTEFSFGYAFTENLIRAANAAPRGAPVFPNLIQEAQLGYDIHIELPGLPLFFQYKLPELMKRNTAFEISKKNLPGIKVPFFRMPLMPSGLSDQHELLIALEKKYPKAVLYASPALPILTPSMRHTTRAPCTRVQCFSRRSILVLCPTKRRTPSHTVWACYAWLNSDPKQIGVITYEMLEARMRHLFEDERFRALTRASSEVRAVIRSLVSAPMREAEAAIATRINTRRSAQPETSEEQGHAVEDILVAREMARVDLGVDLLVSQPR
jgi:hypothetical protein